MITKEQPPNNNLEAIDLLWAEMPKSVSWSVNLNKETPKAPLRAVSVLDSAAGHMNDRAKTYDKPTGERSMVATVAAFNAATGHPLTEEQGWMFMVFLKSIRSQQGNYKADNYEDLVAYGALMAEAANQERNHGQ